ncbi:BatD family protein [Flavihumibacter petaseus]|uniref:Protein BatD n=1 Tax=Flavihumibacter petaseus NBRC 106054 TaxID=1220578 RepID=A0A0E9MVU7_9BACT|nr:BatD family protein [Flavihumibacter petaseus]GAO41714.1 hypothetical protein FPE01S_01_07280 [Flavihumibacter petaseus NBRC 106054]
MIRRIIQICLFAGALLTVRQASAQHIHLKASVNRDKILIGEPVLLQLELSAPQGSTHDWFRTDSLPHFEIIEAGKIDTATGVDGDFFKQVLTITSFDSGSWTIPMLSLTVNNNRYLTDSVSIEVGYTPTDPNQPYHDIKEIIEVPEAEPLYINYIIAVVTLIAIAVAAYLLWRKKKKPQEQPVVKASSQNPFERAMGAIQELKAAGTPAGESIKRYYVQLNDILRQYLKDKRFVNTQDAGNRELLLTVRPQLDSDTAHQLEHALQLADAAKFAKYQPDAQTHGQALEAVRLSIEKLEKIDNTVLR